MSLGFEHLLFLVVFVVVSAEQDECEKRIGVKWIEREKTMPLTQVVCTV